MLFIIVHPMASHGHPQLTTWVPRWVATVDWPGENLLRGTPMPLGFEAKYVGKCLKIQGSRPTTFIFFGIDPSFFKGTRDNRRLSISRLIVALVSICHHSPVVGKAWEVLLYSSTNMRKKDIHGWSSPQIVSYIPNKWLTPRVNCSEPFNCSHCWNSQHTSLLVYYCEWYHIKYKSVWSTMSWDHHLSIGCGGISFWCII